MMYPASLATLELAPMNTTMGVRSFRGVARASCRIRAEKRPNFSARPMPSMATNTRPRAGRPVKLRTIEESIQ
jgi:hypothetical protein